MLGLSVPASAYTYDYFFKSPQADRGFGSGSSTNSDSAIAFRDAQNENSKAFFQLLLSNLSMSKSWKYTTDQSNDASVSVGEYLTYALHGLKGTFQNSGTLVSMSPDNGSGVGYVYDSAKDYFVSTWVGSRPTITSTDANRWRVQTLSDNHSGSWMYQVAHSLAQSGLTAEALMNWSNPDGGTLFVPATSAKYSWFNQVLDAVNNSKVDVSGLAKQATLYSFFNLFNSVYNLPNYVSQNPGEFSTGYYGSVNFADGLIRLLQGNNTGLIAINDNIRNLDNFLRTENDQKLLKTTDNKKTYVNDFVYTRDDSYYQSFEIGSMIQETLSPDIYVGDATNALGDLLQGTNDDYWGWFSSATDFDLHPAASGVSTLSLDDEPSSQDIADSETVWVINPFASSSDLVSDFFGGE